MKGQIARVTAAICLLKKSIGKQRSKPTPLALLPKPSAKGDAIISTCDTIVHAARSRVTANRAKRNVGLPIHRLPIELLVYIFHEALRCLPSTTPPSKALRDLRLVSVHWSKVIEGAASLWSITSCLDPEKAVTLALHRSRGSMLHVSCVCSEKLERYDYAAKVVPFAKRWRTLTVSVRSKATVVKYLAARAPNLQELSVTCTYTPGGTIDRALFEVAAPKLRTLELSRCPLPWASVGLSGLQSLVIQHVRDGAPTVQMVVFVLECSPAIEVLKINNCSIQADESTMTKKRLPIALRSLRSLQIKDIGAQAVSQLLDSIIYRDDTTLEVDVGYTEEWSATVLEHAERQIARTQDYEAEHIFCVEASSYSLKFTFADKRVVINLTDDHQGWKNDTERIQVLQFVLNHYFRPALDGFNPWFQYYSSASATERLHKELLICHQALPDIRVLVTTYKHIQRIVQFLSCPTITDGEILWLFPGMLYVWVVDPDTSDGLECLVNLAETRLANGFTRPLHQLRVDGAEIAQKKLNLLRELIPYVSVVGTITEEEEKDKTVKKSDKNP
ncbi:hypothetical protein FRC01_008366 [Tulasnella sp. 417]|nr:hypothetical protein FRC01_008366 [Tulasnella sp. 417]